MTDRELLELAAKACGIDVGGDDFRDEVLRKYEPSLGLWVRYGSTSIGYWWNPLNDDGDALRLAVSLYSRGFMLEAGSGGITVTVSHPVIMSDEWCPSEGAFNPNDATRRAIVRAAAEIGKSM